MHLWNPFGFQVSVFAKGRSVVWGCFHCFRRCTCFLSIRGMKKGKAEPWIWRSSDVTCSSEESEPTLIITEVSLCCSLNGFESFCSSPSAPRTQRRSGFPEVQRQCVKHKTASKDMFANNLVIWLRLHLKPPLAVDRWYSARGFNGLASKTHNIAFEVSDSC